ncbi:uncharacterized protein BX664DRAFT_362561 [Halteromyces radiatus]|uniref:uncharacterized protein n=1 Tax=Halteromyces radiatus TaxID=101107 RepID=UPI0022208AAB|nr:uncharacterized protein BX664DRAFT_362561 [Halteromyces radiatus]KAI8077777.1 hypothetical protein BX664DRAFT_362561 [Halteromyces radiatus]
MLDCGVCLESFSGNEVSALHCGHVYHTSCIQLWLATKPRCPSCNQVCTQNNPLIRLYMSFDHNHNFTSPDSQDDMTQEARLRDSCNNLRKQVEEVTQRLKTERQLMEKAEKDKNLYLNKVNIYKTIKGVLDLEKRLATPQRQYQMRQWRSLPRDELSLLTCSLYERYQDLKMELENKHTQLERSYHRINDLKKKYKRSKAMQNIINIGIDKCSLERIGRHRSIRSSGTNNKTKEHLSAKKFSKQPAIPLDVEDDDTMDEDDQLITPLTTAHQQQEQDNQYLDNSTNMIQSSSSSANSPQYRINLLEDNEDNHSSRSSQMESENESTDMEEDLDHGSNNDDYMESNDDIFDSLRQQQSFSQTPEIIDSGSDDDDHDDDDGRSNSNHSSIPRVNFQSPKRPMTTSRIGLQRVIELSSDDDEPL